MANGNNEQNKGERMFRNRIARAVFTAAESQGLSDRDVIEQITDKVINRLEHLPTLPGMEHLAPITRRPVQDTEIQSMVRNILAEKKPDEITPPPETEKKKTSKTAKITNVVSTES